METITTVRKIIGILTLLLGVFGLLCLVFFFGVVLFSDTYSSLEWLNSLFRTIFTIPTGLVVIYTTFVIFFVPFFLCTLFGFQLLSNKKVVHKLYLAILLGIWIFAIVLFGFTVTHQVATLLSRMSPFSQNPVVQTIGNDIPLSTQYAFKTTLKNEVQDTLGQPIEGYTPDMFLEVFPGLTPTDFEGVEASIGVYAIKDGKLIHVLDTTKLIHSAAGAITDRGLDTLLSNVAIRLKVNLTQDGTLTEIMEALVRYSQTVPVPEEDGTVVPQPEPVACTMDAKICPDGSAVGRTAPNCEFAPCPTNTAVSEHVCTKQEKQAQICTLDYRPVCGKVPVQCVTTPCDPVPQTFSNGCSACSQQAISYTEGECTL